MSFDTLSFWVIFAVVLAIYWNLRQVWQNYLLLAASLLFYSVWNINFTVLLLIAAGIDFIVALTLEKTEKIQWRRFLLIISLATNLGLLFFFKYYLFYVHQEHSFLKEFPQFESIYKWGLPLGISFYTFQILSYTIDVYKKKIPATKSFRDFILFVSFFPQLVCGPIEKARFLLPQIQNSRNFRWENVEQGLYLCLWGLFKKLYVANGIAYPIDSYFGQSHAMQGLDTILVFSFMTFQVYADFSGYSDIARGLAQTLGFDLTINFRPFWTSKNPLEFWQKWNVSLTRWLRDYVFLPLHKKSEALWVEFSKIILIMALVGIWHAPEINWLLFGVYNGILIVLYSLIRKFKIFPGAMGFIFLFFLYIGNGILHRSATLGLIYKNVMNLGHWSSWVSAYDLIRYGLLFLTPMIVLETSGRFHQSGRKIYLNSFFGRVLFVSFCLIAIVCLDRSYRIGFIYFDF